MRERSLASGIPNPAYSLWLSLVNAALMSLDQRTHLAVSHHKSANANECTNQEGAFKYHKRVPTQVV